MGLLRSLFGPSREEVWRELCQQMRAHYVEGGFFGGDRLVARAGQWTITLDSYTRSSSHGKHHHHTTTYTRLRAAYVNPQGLRFRIYRASIFSPLGTFFGMQDISVGDEGFDQDFVVQGSDEARVRQLLADATIRQLMHEQPSFHLEVKDDEGWFGSDFPEGVDELVFEVPEDIRDVERLRGLYELFALVLHRLCAMGAAYENDPGVKL